MSLNSNLLSSMFSGRTRKCIAVCVCYEQMYFGIETNNQYYSYIIIFVDSPISKVGLLKNSLFVEMK